MTLIPNKRILIASSILILTALTILLVDFFNLWISAIFLPIILILLSIIFWIFIRLKLVYTRLQYLFILLASTIIVSLVSSHMILNKQIIISQNRAKIIINELNDYKNINGIYPANLNMLLSQRFEEIPTTALGVFTSHEFNYYKSDENFVLCFKWDIIDIAGVYLFSSDNRKWRYDD